jgi:hypothetical protein
VGGLLLAVSAAAVAAEPMLRCHLRSTESKARQADGKRLSRAVLFLRQIRERNARGLDESRNPGAPPPRNSPLPVRGVLEACVEAVWKQTDRRFRRVSQTPRLGKMQRHVRRPASRRNPARPRQAHGASACLVLFQIPNSVFLELHKFHGRTNTATAGRDLEFGLLTTMMFFFGSSATSTVFIQFLHVHATRCSPPNFSPDVHVMGSSSRMIPVWERVRQRKLAAGIGSFGPASWDGLCLPIFLFLFSSRRWGAGAQGTGMEDGGMGIWKGR